MQNHSAIVFGGGCFWCTEAVFKMLRGVERVTPGFAGGTTPDPTYEDTARGMNNHAEVVEIEYDPTILTFRDLLTVFFASHDATQVNRQGNDVGEQYRSLILYTTPEQKAESEKFIEELNESAADGDPIATQVKPLDHFYAADAEHKNFYERNQNLGYCQIIIAPKLQKVQKEFARLLNPET